MPVMAQASSHATGYLAWLCCNHHTASWMLAVEGLLVALSKVYCLPQVAPLQARAALVNKSTVLSLARVPKSAPSAALEVTGHCLRLPKSHARSAHTTVCWPI